MASSITTRGKSVINHGSNSVSTRVKTRARNEEEEEEEDGDEPITNQPQRSRVQKKQRMDDNGTESDGKTERGRDK
jgi:hypothetical protein